MYSKLNDGAVLGLKACREVWCGTLVVAFIGLFGGSMTSMRAAPVSNLSALWQERIGCVVAVEFYIQEETERRPVITTGTVIDRSGTVILAGSAIPTYLPPSELKNFRVHRPGVINTEYSKADYLGFDEVSGWHFIRLQSPGLSGLRPITDFIVAGTPEATIADQVWGVALRGKEEDFAPLFLRANVNFVAHLPQATAFADNFVSGQQLPVFDSAGSFLGLGAAGFGESFVEYTESQRGTPLLLVSRDQSRVFRLAGDVLPFLQRVPKNVMGRPLPWIGVSGLQPLSNEVARYLKLENQSAIVVSDVLTPSPAENAGLKERDIIIAVDGRPLPRFAPSRAVTIWFEREIGLRTVGSPIVLTVLRGDRRIELKPVLEEEPKILREAARDYFDRLGFSAREFLFWDAVANRIPFVEGRGVVVQFVKPNSPAAVVGLRAEDWVREIDGEEVKSFAEAIEKLSGIEKNPSRPEVVLLISRGGETSVLRVRLL